MMWSLGKVVQTPEVMRVYLSSFWTEKPPNCFEDCRDLIEAESKDLLRDLKELRRNAAIRKINEIVKRARLARVRSMLIINGGKNLLIMRFYVEYIGTFSDHWPFKEGNALHVWQEEKERSIAKKLRSRVFEDSAAPPFACRRLSKS